MKIAEVMTKDPCCVQCDAPLREAHRLMRALGARHLPVLAGDRLVGVVSERDLYLLETVRSVDAGIHWSVILPPLTPPTPGLTFSAVSSVLEGRSDSFVLFAAGNTIFGRASPHVASTVASAASVREVVREMREKRYGSAVVVEKGRVTGIFTRADALRTLEALLK